MSPAEGSSDSNVSDSGGDVFGSAAAPSLGRFNEGDTVRVWWATKEPAAWYMGVVELERVMPQWKCITKSLTRMHQTE